MFSIGTISISLLLLHRDNYSHQLSRLTLFTLAPKKLLQVRPYFLESLFLVSITRTLCSPMMVGISGCSDPSNLFLVFINSLPHSSASLSRPDSVMLMQDDSPKLQNFFYASSWLALLALLPPITGLDDGMLMQDYQCSSLDAQAPDVSFSSWCRAPQALLPPWADIDSGMLTQD